VIGIEILKASRMLRKIVPLAQTAYATNIEA